MTVTEFAVVNLVDFAPLVPMLLIGAGLAAPLLLWTWWRRRAASPAERLMALTTLTLFLTFDLILFGAFTRLTDSGLGCPDWPGCYGRTSPVGARAAIDAEQTRMPTGPVTHAKAWIEMVHRYLATAVGALIVLSVALQARWRRAQGAGPHALGWALMTLVWVVAQGIFGALTVTMKLFPAIVTAHLLGGLGLLALLAVQLARQRAAVGGAVAAPGLGSRDRIILGGLLALALVQIALGGWTSTNYAVLACTEFPRCQGGWWPSMNFAEGFTLWRPLGLTPAGEPISFAALTAIHYIHRLFAYVVLLALWAVGFWMLRGSGVPSGGQDAAARGGRRRLGWMLIALGGWQLMTGLSNVVLGWPLLAAVAHTGGAAVLVALLVFQLAQPTAVQTRHRTIDRTVAASTRSPA